MVPRPRRARWPARLSELGFVRDYPGMAYYAGWSQNLEQDRAWHRHHRSSAMETNLNQTEPARSAFITIAL